MLNKIKINIEVNNQISEYSARLRKHKEAIKRVVGLYGRDLEGKSQEEINWRMQTLLRELSRNRLLCPFYPHYEKEWESVGREGWQEKRYSLPVLMALLTYCRQENQRSNTCDAYTQRVADGTLPGIIDKILVS